MLDEDEGVVGIVSADDVLAAVSEELAGVVQALRSGIAREQRERRVSAPAPALRPVCPGFGTLASQ